MSGLVKSNSSCVSAREENRGLLGVGELLRNYYRLIAISIDYCKIHYHCYLATQEQPKITQMVELGITTIVGIRMG